MLVNESRETNRVSLFFVSVLEKYRGKKVGSKLIRYVAKYFEDYELMKGTQARNIKAINFYMRNGFSIVDNTKIVMHRWN